MLHPRLPRELETIIFIEAFRNQADDLPSLFLVAKRVRAWLAPIAFKVVIVQANRVFPLGFQSISHFEDYGIHIQHLLVLDETWQDITKNLDKCLSYCPNITDLGLWQNQLGVKLESFLNLSKLTRLGVDVKYIAYPIGAITTAAQFQNTPTPNPVATATANIALFPNITHLNIVGPSANYDLVEILARHFPNLSHISMEISSAYLAPLIFVSVLRFFKHLKTLVWWEKGEPQTSRPRPIRLDDPRVVSIVMNSVKGWENSARGEQSGIWELADEMIMKKRI
ncbi:hypothetical protein BDN72DRAFT_845200 [Pluteus cervinus]|uniref:Uncharacterized protein n=1 Tax=Pluteus cervinus TaxID=181527 RepID=A0ACD3AJP1_9AGAR|nr:hypothetical protein BDN72DRAFT_845200 [Pluteus cervinus]